MRNKWYYPWPVIIVKILATRSLRVMDFAFTCISNVSLCDVTASFCARVNVPFGFRTSRLSFIVFMKFSATLKLFSRVCFNSFRHLGELLSVFIISTHFSGVLGNTDFTFVTALDFLLGDLNRTWSGLSSSSSFSFCSFTLILQFVTRYTSFIFLATSSFRFIFFCFFFSVHCCFFLFFFPASAL